MKKQKKPDSDEELDMSDDDLETSSSDEDDLSTHRKEYNAWFCANCDQKKTCIIDETCDKCSNPICRDCVHKYIKAHVDYYTEQQMDIYLNNVSDDEEEPGQESEPLNEEENDKAEEARDAAFGEKCQEYKQLVMEKVEHDFDCRSNDYDTFQCIKCDEHNFEVLGLKLDS
jgi:hypothetical protein